ncbi:DUF6339 family protein [Salinibacter ruber]|uniref:DUF6339 family protein n=1 Tax=Salinibacter ruber TaxID=146919 RepID=UPI0021673EDB|nr:DUF6339 family protein [Salinibacter ruber]MCS3782677.1 hypothetical protein [Salinibacter ruber]
MQPLRKLSSRVVDKLDERFLMGERGVETSQFLSDLPRDGSSIKIDPLEDVLSKASDKFENNPTASDAWIAPRLHSVLRLRRREVADEGVWNYLAVDAFPDYVRWRWKKRGGDMPATKRFVGPRREQAFARLWWWAELTWNGDSYKATRKIFQSTDMVKFANYRYFRIRPAAIAVARLVDMANGGEGITTDQAQDFARSLNFYLTTNALDSIYSDSTSYDQVDPDWYSADTRTRLDSVDHPEAPGDGYVPERDIQSVYPLLIRVARTVEGLNIDEDDLRPEGGGGSSDSQNPSVEASEPASAAA